MYKMLLGIRMNESLYQCWLGCQVVFCQKGWNGHEQHVSCNVAFFLMCLRFFDLNMRFLETMYRGRDYYILSTDSSLLEVECALTRNREVFRLRWDSKKERQIPIEQLIQMRTFKVTWRKFPDFLDVFFFGP